MKETAERARRRARMLRLGTESHYEDPAYYDHAYRRRREDVAFYAGLAADHGGPVLELGVGTGRVAIAMARQGVSVTGVDRMAPMLARCRASLREEPEAVRARVTLVRGDLRKVRLRRRFPLVVSPFNVFQHLYERADLEGALETVRAHLAPGGRFVFDVLHPDVAALARNPARFYRNRPVLRPSEGKRFEYGETFQYDPVRQVQLVTMFFQAVDDPSELALTPLAHRQFFPAELEALLHYNGFAIERRYGGFDGSPLTATSESQILVVRRANDRRARRRGPAR